MIVKSINLSRLESKTIVTTISSFPQEVHLLYDIILYDLTVMGVNF